MSILILLVGVIRILKYKEAKKQSNEYESNVIDLKDLYEGGVKKLEGKSILLEEKDVDYDLLNRDITIDYLYNTIVTTNPAGKFVISLEGKLGSGKTTIIRNVKRLILENHKDIVIIDKFDPWIYSDENALLLNMYNLIIQKSGFKYSNLFTKKIAKDLSELVLGTNKSGIIKSILFENNAVTMKSRINDYLKLSGKKLVYFIDNIDRTEKENVILLFKLVGSILDFERIIYVLSFDDERVKKIFEKELDVDYEYLKKIINLQIRVPKIDKSVLYNLYSTSLKNVLILHGENDENLDTYNHFIEFISNQRTDVRDFKRFINSAVNLSFATAHFLSKKDLLIMQYTKMFNFPLYKSIHDNKEYFISYDTAHDNQLLEYTTNREDFNKKGKVFFSNLFKDPINESYKDILSEIFPYVNKYSKGENLVYTGGLISEDPDYSTISKLRGISSAKYFDLYFTETSNTYIEVGKIVENLISKINNQETLRNKELLLEDTFREIDCSYHKEIFERIEVSLDDIKEENIYFFVNLIFNNITIIDNSLQFMSLNARQRSALILHILLNKISDTEYMDLLESMTQEYGKLKFLQDVLYWFNNDRESLNVDGRKELLEEVVDSIAADVLNNNVNLYEDIYYIPKNILGLYRVYDGESDKIKYYIKGIINETNIFRMLNDIIMTSIGTDGFRYFISEELLNFFSNKDDIDSILNKTVPKTKDQEFVLEVYKSYDKNLRDTWGEPGILLNEEKNLVHL